MNFLTKRNKQPLAIILGMTLAAAGNIALAGGGTRVECDNDSVAGDANMAARSESRGDREKFDTSFEAFPGGPYVAGDVLSVVVNETDDVGTITLGTGCDVVGDVCGELNYDSTADPDDEDDPFPAGFPAVGAGTLVQIVAADGTTIGCRLSDR